MREPAVALTMPNDIRKRFFAYRERGRTPQRPVLVPYVDHLSRTIRDGIVGPGSELILLAVRGPGVTATFDRGLEAERRIGNDVDPWRRRPLPGAQDGHIFAAVFGEAAQTIGEYFALRLRRVLHAI